MRPLMMTGWRDPTIALVVEISLDFRYVLSHVVIEKRDGSPADCNFGRLVSSADRYGRRG